MRPDDSSPSHEEWSAFYTSLFDRFYPIMKQQALSVTHNPVIAEDAIQDAFIRLMGKHEKLTPLCDQQLVYYIVKTVRCSAIDLLRQRAKDQKHTYICDTEDEVEQIPDEQTPEQVLESGEQYSVLAAAMRTLPNEMRDLLICRYFLSQTTSELASRYQTSPANILQRLSRARRRLLQLIRGDTHEP